jgi:predicted nucleic acid-binding protein
MLEVPEPKVQAWVDRQSEPLMWTTSVNIFEVQLGLQVMPAGKRKLALLERFERLLYEIDHRVVVFDEEAASQAALLAASRQRVGRVGELRDTMIAGIVLSRNASLATRNVAHFSDISAPIINPWVA